MFVFAARQPTICAAPSGRTVPLPASIPFGWRIKWTKARIFQVAICAVTLLPIRLILLLATLPPSLTCACLVNWTRDKKGAWSALINRRMISLTCAIGRLQLKIFSVFVRRTGTA